MKKLLFISLLLNVALLAVVWSRNLRQAPMPRVPRAQIGQPAKNTFRRSERHRATPALPKTPWEAIEDADLSRFMANMRAIGCPEQTIRDILMFRVCRGFRNRLLEFEGPVIARLGLHAQSDRLEAP